MTSDSPKFRELPDDCSCLGEGPAPVRSVPRFGAMPELITYQCPACGHVETVETQPNTPLTIGER
jgi:rubredoxin